MCDLCFYHQKLYSFFINKAVLHPALDVCLTLLTLMLCLCAIQVFAYDYCFWSMDETDKEKFAG